MLVHQWIAWLENLPKSADVAHRSYGEDGSHYDTLAALTIQVRDDGTTTLIVEAGENEA